jgi:uncharacterized protein (DUF885 family)
MEARSVKFIANAQQMSRRDRWADVHDVVARPGQCAAYMVGTNHKGPTSSGMTDE